MSAAPDIRNIAVLGATGSIGRSAAAVIAAGPERFRLYAAAARRDADELLRQCASLHPSVVALTDANAARDAAKSLPSGAKMLAGNDALAEIAALPEVDTVLCAVPGIDGLRAVIAALRAGKRVALASKEILVTAGDIVTAIPSGGIVPVDSEHSGIFQCLAGRKKSEISRITLTASGGPFRTWSRERIAAATFADTLDHPVWKMGTKVTVDSATLMNKVLEMIAARHLFDLPPERLDAVIHPQSVVHALVELCDGSVIAQLANPDMKLAIQYALGCPERPANRPAGTLDLVKVGKLEFYAPDEERFPALAVGRRAMELGGAAPAVLNAANEVAVERFVRGEISLPRIWELAAEALEHCVNFDDGTLESRLAADAAAREFVTELIECRKK